MDILGIPAFTEAAVEPSAVAAVTGDLKKVKPEVAINSPSAADPVLACPPDPVNLRGGE
jgi:hypothetical protein